MIIIQGVDDVLLARAALLPALLTDVALKLVVPQDVVVEGESDIVCSVDALRQSSPEVTPVDVVFALELQVQLVD